MTTLSELCGDNGNLKNARSGDKNTRAELQWREKANDGHLKEAEWAIITWSKEALP